MRAVAGVFSGFMALVVGLAGILVTIGGIYWMWIAIQIGSFTMFLVGMLPPAWIITGVVGAYSLLFGVPRWIFNWFA